MAGDNLPQPSLQIGTALAVVETDVEPGRGFGRDDIGRRIANLQVDNLKI